MLCLLGHPDCGVVYSSPMVLKVGDAVRIGYSVVVRVLGTGSSMLGNTYRLLSSSGRYSFNGMWIPVFGVRIQEEA